MLYLLVLLSTGQIGGVSGPLPYDMTECRKRAEAAQHELRVEGPAAVAAGRLVVVPDWRFVCVERSNRPQLGDRLEDR